jgi:peptide/nickel transport system ATP-binding protein
MYLGEIVETGPREAIFGNPQHPYTRRLLAAVPIADPRRRHRMQPIVSDEITSPVRPANYVAPARLYKTVSPGHTVMVWGEEWESPPRSHTANEIADTVNASSSGEAAISSQAGLHT